MSSAFISLNFQFIGFFNFPVQLITLCVIQTWTTMEKNTRNVSEGGCLSDKYNHRVEASDQVRMIHGENEKKNDN